MKRNKLPKILVLGATGTLGRTVYKFLKKIFPNSVWATTRNKSTQQNFIFFDCYNYQLELPQLLRKCKPKYIINCIGALRNTSSFKDMQFINGEFPHILFRYSKKYSCNIIHISTDAVFSENSGFVDECVKPSPSDKYGLSKLYGELKKDNLLNVRTSFLGFDPIHHKGLFEWLLKNKNKTIFGFTNQLWSGCTTLQFAKFISWIILNNNFNKLRKHSHVFHFPPLGPITKYEILESFIHISNQNSVVKQSEGRAINRALVTKYANEMQLDSYKQNVDDIIRKLFIFEQKHI